MNRPKTLTGEAAEFWKKHAKRCEDEGTLTASTFETFILLCRTWQLLADLDPATDPKGMLSWNGTIKTYERLALQFGIFSKRKVEKPKDLAAIIRDL